MRLTNFRPVLKPHRIEEIDIDDLLRRGIKALLIDIDNTLVGHNACEIDPKTMEWLRSLDDYLISFCLITNNCNNPMIKVVISAMKIDPEPTVFRGRWPFPRPFLYSLKKAIAFLDRQPGEIAVIGDSIITDIWPGNRLGCLTIYVDPIDLEAEKSCFLIRCGRLIEHLLFLSRLI